MKVIVTVTCSNYLGAAIALARSAKRNLTSHIFVACLLERSLPAEPIEDSPFDRCVLAHELFGEEFNRFIFAFSLVEAATVIKPTLFKWLLERFPEVDSLVYLDPDMLVFRDFDEVWAGLERHEVLLTPHVLHDEPTYVGTRDNLLRVLRFGTFNLGFCAVRCSVAARNVLDWWQRKLDWFCFEEPEAGIFVDQKWMDLAPCLFDVGVLKSSAYNVANWNVERRQLRLDGGEFKTGFERLALYHFSGFFSDKDVRFVEKSIADRDHAFFKIRGLYAETLTSSGHESYWRIPWSYSTFASGEQIDHRSRLAYRRAPRALSVEAIDPFRLSNSEFLPNQSAIGTKGRT